MKNNFQKILLVASAIFLIVPCFAFIFLYGKINDNNQKAEQDMKNYLAETIRRNGIKSLNQTLIDITDKRAQLDTHFAQSSDVVPFLDTIEKLAPGVGAAAAVDSVETSADNSGLLVGLKATGSFEALYKFLTLLENSPYEIDFSSIDIHKSATGTTPIKGAASSGWEATFKIKLLSFIP